MIRFANWALCLFGLVGLLALMASANASNLAYRQMVSTTPGVVHAYDIGVNGTDLVGLSNFSITGSGTSSAINGYVDGWTPSTNTSYYNNASITVWTNSQNWATEAIFRLTTNGTNQCIVCSTNGVPGLVLSLNNAGQIAFQLDGSSGSISVATTATTYGDGQFHHVVVNYYAGGACSNNDWFLIVDGVQVSQTCSGSLLGAPTTPAALQLAGRSGTTTNQPNGYVGMIAFYNQPISVPLASLHYTCASTGVCTGNATTCGSYPNPIWCENFDSYSTGGTVPSPWTAAADFKTSDFVFWSYFNSAKIGRSGNYSTRPLNGSFKTVVVDMQIMFSDPLCGGCGWTLPVVALDTTSGRTGFLFGQISSPSVGFVGIQAFTEFGNIGSAFQASVGVWHHVKMIATASAGSDGSFYLEVDGTPQVSVSGATVNAGELWKNFYVQGQLVGGSPTDNAEAWFDNIGTFAQFSGGPIVVTGD